MFNLEQEIDNWCESIFKKGSSTHLLLDELKDHLHCEIERLKKEGLSSEDAFAKATSKMGLVNELSAEFAKIRSPVQKCITPLLSSPDTFTEDNYHTMKQRKSAVLNILVSLLFAGAIILSSLLLKDSDIASTVTFVLIGLWWIPFSYFIAQTSGNRWTLKGEYQCLRRRVTSLFGKV